MDGPRANARPRCYFDLCVSIPIPTAQQTAQLAEDLNLHRDWLEGVGLTPPGRRLVFLLDPHAGRVHRLAPEVYRARFGCWEFHIEYGAPLTVTSPEGAHVRVPSDAIEHCALALPDELLGAPMDTLRGSLQRALSAARDVLSLWRATSAALDYVEGLVDLYDMRGERGDVDRLRLAFSGLTPTRPSGISGGGAGSGAYALTCESLLSNLFVPVSISRNYREELLEVARSSLRNTFLSAEEFIRHPDHRLDDARTQYDEARRALAAHGVTLAPIAARRPARHAVQEALHALRWGEERRLHPEVREAFDRVAAATGAR